MLSSEGSGLVPLRKVEPGDNVTLVEYWGLFDDLPKPNKDEVFAKKFRPAIEKWIKAL